MRFKKHIDISEKEKKIKKLREQLDVVNDKNKKKEIMKEIFNILSTLKNKDTEG
ncbi:hypothetical protein SAMN02745164_00495 [Marinitoga hydrogenitolerans DSM 16785]|uniref:Uncharacterized protein n=1 Tax=Marinitoga hydrogenitolerans (strain DSM 16785 / JCM 12826 / AT1271) TaxID=1122195 RepID=A0A1M4TSJ7_MARH1|nr:hypothetical protein [Marinitoga hydrogenitolerans]SHE47413.1 hypothetical protein SAMN02745164_00495 [Marinitoga hydrogenitolerans DSM 16785]